ncbi:MAG: hypothetical protein R3E12_05540 [Candidatus Eisenbacteria bacterium]|uniref:DUF3775 domain-containing protein n=1 Tax=Eiseniibacteriota bacterium TaxID=2212470 RepID=A0A956M3S4_UNCEI|nr:hypothetical protein [Candidatus Eisenbacteria bacterium]
MVPLSAATRDRLDVLFEGAERAEAEQILLYECVGERNGTEDRTPESLERLRFAVLKVSDGDLDELKRAIAWSRVDFRDVLVWAGFHRDPRDHSDWFPESDG